MIPTEVAAIAELIDPDYDRDDETRIAVIGAAYRIYNAGYRLASQDPN